MMEEKINNEKGKMRQKNGVNIDTCKTWKQHDTLFDTHLALHTLLQ